MALSIEQLRLLLESPCKLVPLPLLLRVPNALGLVLQTLQGLKFPLQFLDGLGRRGVRHDLRFQAFTLIVGEILLVPFLDIERGHGLLAKSTLRPTCLNLLETLPEILPPSPNRLVDRLWT